MKKHAASGNLNQGETEKSFQEIIQRYRHGVMNRCYAVLTRHLTPAEAKSILEDLATNVFSRAYRAYAQFKGGSLKAWLGKIASNEAYTFLHNRIHNRQKEKVETIPRDEPDPAILSVLDQIITRESEEKKRRILEKLMEWMDDPGVLSPKQRLALKWVIVSNNLLGRKFQRRKRPDSKATLKPNYPILKIGYERTKAGGISGKIDWAFLETLGLDLRRAPGYLSSLRRLLDEFLKVFPQNLPPPNAFHRLYQREAIPKIRKKAASHFGRF